MRFGYAVLAGVITMASVPAPAVAVPHASAAPHTTVTRDGARLDVERAHTVGVAAPKLAAAATTSTMDLDRDGKDEIVAGGFIDNGYGVIVTYSGLPQRDLIESPIFSPTRPNFGDAMTSGDFNGDGYGDLAVGNPGEFAPTGADRAFGGAVWIFYGGASGLNLDQPQHINQNVAGVPGDMESYDMFGHAVAAGDLNGDGRDDLAIGAYGDKVNGQPNAGSVTVLYGAAGGLATTGTQFLTQETAGIPGTAVTDDSFGYGLAVGDMTRDGYADLAISAPSDTNATNESGLIMLLRGSATGVVTTGITSFNGASRGLSAIGEGMAIADIDGDGDGDLVAAAPRSWIGYLIYVPGVAAGLDVARVRTISMETPGVPGDPNVHLPDETPHAYFGNALSTGDVTGDGRADVLTGAITYDANGVRDSGAVFLIPGQAGGLTGAGTLMLTQRAARAPVRRAQPGCQRPGQYEYFGEANAILNLDGVGALDMLTGTSGEAESGLIVKIGMKYASQRPVAGRPVPVRVAGALTVTSCQTGATLGAHSAGHTLLHH
ncbi:hypothetical protein Pa4123_29680 [Phytohabitans aurantiacus]|uniref:Integrin-like protein n=1 Tax=Phytohabitans aurantiacus TaxID=3016789 RepID=A0ABQ5QSW6_9ACTN|nr:hypothetical protein Pa4123_29680 [Phytohabitans aurantiacus]